MRNLVLDRRDLLLAPLFAAAASSFGIGAAQAAGADPAMTIVVPPDQIPWQPCGAGSVRPTCWRAQDGCGEHASERMETR
jgi:hypothetical protein